MAIDTAEKRRQAIDFGKIRGTGMPIPSGLISGRARLHILNLYIEPSIDVLPVFWRNRNLPHTTWKGNGVPVSAWKGKKSPSSKWQGRIPPPDGTTQVI